MVSRKYTHLHYKRLIDDRVIVQPTAVNHNLRSRCECALVSFIMANCTTINFLGHGGSHVCQVSNKKGSCMEKEEIINEEGYRMFEIMVRFSARCSQDWSGCSKFNQEIPWRDKRCTGGTVLFLSEFNKKRFEMEIWFYFIFPNASFYFFYTTRGPRPTWGIASLRQTTHFTPGYIAEWSCREDLLDLSGMMPSPTQ
jgi:hypothetical protein